MQEWDFWGPGRLARGAARAERHGSCRRTRLPACHPFQPPTGKRFDTAAPAADKASVRQFPSGLGHRFAAYTEHSGDRRVRQLSRIRRPAVKAQQQPAPPLRLHRMVPNAHRGLRRRRDQSRRMARQEVQRRSGPVAFPLQHPRRRAKAASRRSAPRPVWACSRRPRTARIRGFLGCQLLRCRPMRHPQGRRSATRSNPWGNGQAPGRVSQSYRASPSGMGTHFRCRDRRSNLAAGDAARRGGYVGRRGAANSRCGSHVLPQGSAGLRRPKRPSPAYHEGRCIRCEVRARTGRRRHEIGEWVCQ
jgi:hypothetical protein